MISIVICSRQHCPPKRLVENINKTIGCSYELIAIDNSTNKFSIYEAYNQGLVRSHGDLICFLHDDVLFHTQNWGVRLQDIFAAHPDAGLVGVAGAKIKTRMPSAWWDCPEAVRAVHLIQHRPNNTPKLETLGFQQTDLVEVAVIDGVCMVLRRNTGLRMNTKLNGFHGYDVSLSIECRKKGFRVYVTNQLGLEHLSEGTLNESWYDAMIDLHKLHKRDLPQWVTDAVDRQTIQEIEFSNGIRMIRRLKANPTGRRWSMFMLWLQMVKTKPYARLHWDYLKLFLKMAVGRNPENLDF